MSNPTIQLLEEGIYEFLQQNAALDTVLPSTDAIFMGFIPENALSPALMFDQISSVNDNTFDGPSGYKERRYQFTIEAKDTMSVPGSGFVAVKKVADVLRQQMDGLTGTLPNGIRLFNSLLDTDFGRYDPDTEKYMHVMDFILSFSLVTPSTVFV